MSRVRIPVRASSGDRKMYMPSSFITAIASGLTCPGRVSTRNDSFSTRPLSSERLMTQFELMTSTELSKSGMLSNGCLWPESLSVPTQSIWKTEQQNGMSTVLQGEFHPLPQRTGWRIGLFEPNPTTGEVDSNSKPRPIISARSALASAPSPLSSSRAT
jgi:hypothetical protein